MALARKILIRDSQNPFFTAGLPLLDVFIFATIFGDEKAKISGELDVATAMTALPEPAPPLRGCRV